MREGYAAEDGAALHFEGRELLRVVSSRPKARAYRIVRRRRAPARGELPRASAPRSRWRDGSGRPERDPTILAMGGGGFTSEPGDPALDELVLDAVRPARAAHPVPADRVGRPRRADRRVPHHLRRPRRAAPTVLSLFRRHGDPRSLREIVLAQDVIYVGGGSMRNLLAIWRAHGLDAVLREAWQRGIVLAGLSAGAMCWFEGGVHEVVRPAGRRPPASASCPAR